jgi:hypothetical protein
MRAEDLVNGLCHGLADGTEVRFEREQKSHRVVGLIYLLLLLQFNFCFRRLSFGFTRHINRPDLISRRSKIIRDTDFIVNAALFRVPDDHGAALVDLKLLSIFHGCVVDGGNPP